MNIDEAIEIAREEIVTDITKVAVAQIKSKMIELNVARQATRAIEAEMAALRVKLTEDLKNVV